MRFLLIILVSSTVGCLSDTDEALKLVNLNEKLFTTVGCHPTRCNEFEDQTKAESHEKYYELLSQTIEGNRNKVFISCSFEIINFFLTLKTVEFLSVSLVFF